MAAKQIAIINAAIAKLGEAEKTTKTLIAECSVDVLEYLHEHGQAQLLNSMLLVLTPANKKAVTSFFMEFSGFKYDKEELAFTKKIKAEHDPDGNVKQDKYADAKAKFEDFVEAGGNFWTWLRAQEAPKKIEPSKLDLSKLTQTVKKAVKKAKEEGVSDLAVLNALITDCFTPAQVLEFLNMAEKVNKVAECDVLKAKDELAEAKAD